MRTMEMVSGIQRHALRPYANGVLSSLFLNIDEWDERDAPGLLGHDHLSGGIPFIPFIYVQEQDCQLPFHGDKGIKDSGTW